MRGPNYSLARAAACRVSPPGPTAVVIITPPGRVITAVIVQACLYINIRIFDEHASDFEEGIE